CCGVVGLKPSLGRVPRYPSPNCWTGFGVVGPMARTVRDAALFLSVMASPDERDPRSLPDTAEGIPIFGPLQPVQLVSAPSALRQIRLGRSVVFFHRRTAATIAAIMATKAATIAMLDTTSVTSAIASFLRASSQLLASSPLTEPRPPTT